MTAHEEGDESLYPLLAIGSQVSVAVEDEVAEVTEQNSDAGLRHLVSGLFADHGWELVRGVAQWLRSTPHPGATSSARPARRERLPLRRRPS